MEVQEKNNPKKKILQTYAQRINWDALFFKGFLIFGSILLLGLLFFILWVLQW